MIALIIVLAVLVLIALLKVGVIVCLDEGKAVITVVAGPLRITLGGEKKPKKPKKEKKPKKPKKEKKEKKKKNIPELIKRVLGVLPTVFATLGRFCKHLHFDEIKFHYTVGGEDAGDTADKYGKLTALTSAVLPMFHELCIVKKWDVHLGCDFTAEKDIINIKGQITIAIWEIFYIIFKLDFIAIFRLLKELL